MVGEQFLPAADNSASFLNSQNSLRSSCTRQCNHCNGGAVELCTFKLLDTISSQDRLGEECGHGHPGAALLAGHQQGGGQREIGGQAAGGGNGIEAACWCCSNRG